MAVIGNTFLQLIDTLKLADNPTADIVEALHRLNPFMRDANVMECNKGARHMSMIRSGLPSVSWGALYQGIVQSKSTVTAVEDTTGFVEGLSTVDERLLALNKAKAPAIRLMEASAYIESICQQVETAIFYSNVNVNGKQFHGLAPRYNSLANPNVINGGGVGSDNMSIWMVTHGDGQTSVITPEGIPGGVQREDMGRQRVLDSLGNPFYVEEEKFTQHIGISVKDWRFNGRAANIDVSDVIAGTRTLNPLMRQLYYRLQGRRNYNLSNDGMIDQGRTVIYMNRTALEALDAESTNNRATDNFVRLLPREIQGEEVMTWRGLPIRDTDALLNTEALVS